MYYSKTGNIVNDFLKAGADPTIEDRNQRLPLDEATIVNKPGRSDLSVNSNIPDCFF